MKITQKKEVRITYWITCLLCKKEIRGDSPKAAEHNLKAHIDSHKRKLKSKKIDKKELANDMKEYNESKKAKGDK